MENPAALSDAHDVVRRFLVARDNDDDFTEAAALTAPDVVWHSPINGPERGRDAVRRMLEEAREDTAWFHSDLYALDARGSRVTAVVRNVGERKGKRLDSRQVLAFDVTDGEIREIRIFVDDPDAVKAFWNA